MGLSVESKLVGYWLEKRGLSVSELARKLGISPQAVSQWLSGTTSPRRRITDVAEALGLTVAGFWGARDLVEPNTTRGAAAG